MGCTSAEQKSSSSSTQDMTQTTTFAKRTPAEQAVLDQLSGLGMSQTDALMQRIQALTSGTSPYALSPADQQQLDQTYGSAQQQLDLQNKDYADFLSGSLGRRMSDSSIAGQSMQRQALGQAELLSQKANAGLNLGMGASQYRMNSALGLANSLPQGSVAAFNPQFQERLASGTQHMYGTSSSNGSSTSTPSLMSSIGQGIGIAGQLGSLAMPFLAPGVGSLGAMGASGGAAASAGGGGYGGIMGLKAGQAGAMFG